MCRFRADRSRGAAILFVLVMTVAGCRDHRSPSSIDDDARRYVRLAVALGERDRDSLDFYAGPADLVADVRRSPPPLSAIKRDASELSARLAKEPAADPVDLARKQNLLRNLSALVARVDLLTGTRRSYDAESESFFDMTPEPLDERRLAELRSQVAELVGGRGRLADRYAAFASRFIIPADRLPAVVAASLDECRRRTAVRLALPRNEQASVEFVRDRPWAAYSHYVGGGRSVIDVNTDFQLTVDQALQLACHEGYPGHHARSVLMDARPPAARWPERSVQLMFSPASLVSEAAAMAATDVAFSPADRVAVERERLFPLAGLPVGDVERHVAVERLVGDLQVIQGDVARRYLDGELEFARAAALLEEQALVPHAEGVIKYMNEYRSYVTTYTAGRARFAARLAACTGAPAADDARWRCFEDGMLQLMAAARR